MIEIILKRRPIRDFLKNYSSEKWKEVIPNVLEIGVLNLKNSFGTYQFSKEEFNNILYDLRNFKPQQRVPKSNHKPKKHQQQKRQKEESYSYEEEEYRDYDDENEEESFNDTYENQQQQHQQQYVDKKPSTSKAEVFVIGEQEFKNKNRLNNNNRPRRGYYTTQDEIKEKNLENKRNIAYAESKIRAQILNDKMIHKALKNNQPLPYNNNQYQPNTGTNYVINYDKNLRPESVQKFEKENQMYYYSNQSASNIGGCNNNNNNQSNTSQKEVRDENSNYYNNYNNDYMMNNNNNNNESELNFNSNLNYNYMDNSELNNSNQGNNNTRNGFGFNTTNNTGFNKGFSPQPNHYELDDTTHGQQGITVNKDSMRLPIVNSINTVETANFNRGNDNNEINNKATAQSDSNLNFGYNNNTNYYGMNNNDLSTEHQQLNLNSNNNNMNLSGDSEEQLSMCNLSQRTKMLFKREVGNWEQSPSSNIEDDGQSG